MQADFDNSLSRVLVYEGGKVDDPRDPGGRTNRGITQTTYTAWLRQQNRATADVYNITDADVQAIYKGEYWNRIEADNLPLGLDFACFDAGVNSGCSQSVKWLQQALGGRYDGPIDGLMGAKTFSAIAEVAVDEQSTEDLINAYCSHRLATLQKLSTWKTFGKGWEARIANVQKTADAWVVAAEAPQPVDVTSAGGHQKANTSTIQPTTLSQGANHAVTAVVGGGAFASQVAAGMAPVQAAFPNIHWLTGTLAVLTTASALSGVAVKMINTARTAAANGSAKAVLDTNADAAFTTVPVTDKKAS